MKNEKISTKALIILSLSSSYCAEDEELSMNVSDFEITISENPNPYQILGTTNAITNQGTLIFSIIEQSPNNAFQINTLTGELTVLSESLFDFETYPTVTCTVLVKNKNISESASITINFEDDVADNNIEIRTIFDTNIEGTNPEDCWNGSPDINSTNFQDSPLIIANIYESTFEGYITCFASRGLLDFDLTAIPTNINIINVQLVLHKENVTYCPPCAPNQNQNTQLYFKLIDSTFDVSTVNSGNQPSTDNNQSINSHILDIEDINNFDVTNLFLELYSNQNNYQGLMMKITENCIQESVSFFSSNYSDVSKRPKIIIQYD